MDLGLGNLKELKAHLLPEAERSSESYDSVIANIGRGVAGVLESYCCRRFARQVGCQEEYRADRRNVWLGRSPVEVVSKIEIRESLPVGWVELVVADTVVNQDADGWVYFGAELGAWYVSVRITYTGGYWVDTTEDGSGVKPSGAVALPDDLRLAWLMQCGHAWEVVDKLGRNLTRDTIISTGVFEGGAKLTGQVTELLARYRRMAAI